MILKSNSLSARLQKEVTRQADKLLAPKKLQKTFTYYNYHVDNKEEMSALSYLVERSQQGTRLI